VKVAYSKKDQDTCGPGPLCYSAQGPVQRRRRLFSSFIDAVCLRASSRTAGLGCPARSAWPCLLRVPCRPRAVRGQCGGRRALQRRRALFGDDASKPKNRRGLPGDERPESRGRPHAKPVVLLQIPSSLLLAMLAEHVALQRAGPCSAAAVIFLMFS
jgi:hypothetical protein